MAAAVLPVLLRIAARRPASWLAGGIAAATGLALARDASPAAIAAAVACGGWAAVAAAGHVPRGIVAGNAAIDAAIWWTRILWPLGGTVIVGAWLAGTGGGSFFMAAALGILAATAAGAGATRRGAAAADATSLAACSSSTAAAAALVAPAPLPPLAAAAVAASGTLAVAWFVWRSGVALTGPADAGSRSPPASTAEIGLARGGLRRSLTASAMASSLAGLAGWYFLAPEAAAFGCPFAVAWFAVLAAPAALIGPATAATWQGVAGTAAAAGDGLSARARRPTGLRLAVAAAVAHAALLGWPPLVAGLLQPAEATVGPAAAPPWPWVTVAALAAAAAVLAALAALAAAVPLNRETALATAAGLVAAAAAWAALTLPSLPMVPG